jgi:hypothetical protein
MSTTMEVKKLAQQKLEKLEARKSAASWSETPRERNAGLSTTGKRESLDCLIFKPVHSELFH